MEDNIQTVLPSEEVKETPKKKSNVVLIVILACLALFVVPLIVLLTIVIFSSSMFKNLSEVIQEDVVEDTIVQEDTSTDEAMSLFLGDVVTAELPLDWSMEEYFNGEGTELLTEGVTYTGLTGLKIFKDNLEVFYIKAIYGIGFSGCPTYARFEDENPSYYSQIEIDNQEIRDTTDVLDYTNTDYVEFEWFGTTFRRIGNEYHYDIQEGNNYFEPSCVPSLVTLEGLSFNADGQLSEGYSYGTSDGTTEEDLLIIDSILSNMELVD